MDDLTTDKAPFCVFCGRKTDFTSPPIVLKSKIGARRRLAGRCDECGSQVSVFLPSENGPSVYSVRVGASIKWEIERAAALLDISQRAVVENIVDDHLKAFVEDELDRLEEGGLLTRRERTERQRELERPVEEWEPPADRPVKSTARRGLLDWLFR